MKATKSDARYTPTGTKQEHCLICKHFTAPHHCDKVVGPVSPHGWCRFFSHLAHNKLKVRL